MCVIEQTCLPGMGDSIDVVKRTRLERLQEKIYRCRECKHAEPSVVWCTPEPDTIEDGVFACWECGCVDKKHTREARG